MAIKFEKLKPGMVVYDVRKNTGFSSYKQKWNVWPIDILEVDAENRTVFASWNHNKPEWMPEHRATRYRAKPPGE